MRIAVLSDIHGNLSAIPTDAVLAVPYDFASAAEAARRGGRPDWEVALLYGRMKGG